MYHQTVLERNPELLAVDMESGNYFGINSVGSHIWELLENDQTISSVIDSVNQQWDVKNSDTVSKDILAFLKDMQEQDLIETTNA